MKKVVIHVGQAKTGTTTLQKTLNQNRNIILEQGYLYPKPKFVVSHHVLTVPFARNVQRSLVQHLGNDHEIASQIAFQQWDELSKEAKLKNPEVLLLSSEFFYYVPKVGEVPQLIERLFGPHINIELIVYLRSHSEHYISLVQQHLKAHHNLPKNALKSNYREHFGKLSSVGKVIARKFDRKSMKDGDIVTDFCDVVGIDATKLNYKTASENASISAEGMVLLQEYRRKYHRDKPNVFTDDTNQLIRNIAKIEAAHPGMYTKPKLLPEFAQILDRDTDDVAWLRKHFNINLHKEHGISHDASKDVSDVKNVSELMNFDHDLLEGLKKELEL